MAQTYQIGPGDVLEVMVFDEPDLSRTLRVTEDGSITLPLIGEVEVSGKRISAASEAIRVLYERDYLVDPQVSVKIQEFRSQRVEVLGAVKEPGVFYLTSGSSNLINILAQAGGPKEESGRFALIYRLGKDGALAPARIDLFALLDEGKIESNIAILGGDRIFLPSRNEIYVMGEVNKQGAVPYESELSLLQAISKAGGFAAGAALSRVQVIRVVDGKEQILRVDVKRIQSGNGRDVALFPDDVITVPKSIF